jgi:LysM repeat protein
MGRSGNRDGASDDERDFKTGGFEAYDAREKSVYDRAYDDGYGDSRYASAYGPAHDGGYGETGGALVPLSDDSAEVPALYTEPSVPVIIPGTGVSMGTPFIARRERPLTIRLAMITLAVCILLTGLFTVTPLGGGADAQGLTPFQALSGSVVFQRTIQYQWYVARSGDTIEGIAERFHVEIGGIFLLNSMLSGQELQLGAKYKIPLDPFYGKDYEPRLVATGGNGSTTFGSDWWSSYAGDPLPGARCATGDFHTPTSFHMVAPNPGAHWVRGYTWFHNGIDLATTYGNPIVAAQDGQVIWAGWTNTGFGWSVRINHCNHVSTLYGHMAKVLVKAGDNVRAGQPIGLEGSSGWSTGPHLHFSLLVNNSFVDPFAYYAYSVYKITHPCGCYTPA